MPSKIPFSQLSGKKYGRLTIIGDDIIKKRNPRKVKVLCICGVVKYVTLASVKDGRIVSCGCKKKDYTIKRNTIHGMSKHPLYRLWRGIKERCNYKKHISYKWYGAKGVKICKKWENDFMSFYNWAINNGYKKSLVIDRKNNKLSYSPKNCRWVSCKESSRNTTANRVLRYNGVSKCLSEWAEVLGIPRVRISDRLNKLGWSINDALTK